ncbi:hypothetical protein AHAS_Ahas15G0066100 [Arachis hypogaea]
MAGTSKTNRKKGNVPIEHECLLNFLPRDIWVRIATKVTSNSIHDLFNMQVTCKVFLCVASSNAVYQHATMWYIPLVFFSFYLNRPERRFLDRCVEAKNADAILRQGLTEHFWIARRDIGMELLTRASTEGSVEAGYLCAMLPLCDHEDEEEVQRGVEMLEFIHTSGMVERCREFFTDIFWERWIDERSSDQGQTWLVGPPLALPAAPWLMCPVSRLNSDAGGSSLRRLEQVIQQLGSTRSRRSRPLCNSGNEEAGSVEIHPPEPMPPPMWGIFRVSSP